MISVSVVVKKKNPVVTSQVLLLLTLLPLINICHGTIILCLIGYCLISPISCLLSVETHSEEDMIGKLKELRKELGIMRGNQGERE